MQSSVLVSWPELSLLKQQNIRIVAYVQLEITKTSHKICTRVLCRIFPPHSLTYRCHDLSDCYFQYNFLKIYEYQDPGSITRPTSFHEQTVDSLTPKLTFQERSNMLSLLDLNDNSNTLDRRSPKPSLRAFMCSNRDIPHTLCMRVLPAFYDF